MPDGTGDEVVSPTFAVLNQLGWDMQYIRTKLTYDGSAKTFVWQKSGTGYSMTLGIVDLNAGSLIEGFRAMAAAIESGADGNIPPVENFGMTSWTFDQLKAMYDHLLIIASKVMTEKRTLTMRTTSLVGTYVVLTIGDVASSSTSIRLAIKTLAGLISQGLG